MEEKNVQQEEGLVVSAKKNKTGFSRKKMIDRIFIFSMLIIPIIHWLVSWLFVNIQSVLMAFQLPTGEWSTLNFEIFFSAPLLIFHGSSIE